MITSTTFAPSYISAPGVTAPQGATLVNALLEACQQQDATGTNFAVYAPAAKQLLLCLFDQDNQEHQLAMHPSAEGVWHLYVQQISAGQAYAFRAQGDWSPEQTPRFNEHKLLLDPYAREIKGEVSWCGALFDYQIKDKNKVFNDTDSAPFMPRCVVRESEFDWQGVTPPRTPDQKSVIYETHLKGYTCQNKSIPAEIRGTYLGMCHPITIAYLKELGITAVELLPITSKVSEERLISLGLSNYWGYNSICMMAPEPSYASKDPVTELKTMVRELHRVGIEVLMDVVYNHTCESGHGGPFLSMRGLAEDEYYHMETRDGKLDAINYTGCGNTVNFDHAQTLKLTMDTLRNWVQEYHIDGFRFDLAPTMARVHRHFSTHSPFFFSVRQDPILSQVKMIAEPWDIGPDGYQLTRFPKDWQSWNDRYRDGSRKFWNRKKGSQTDMAHRFAGSQDLFTEQSYLGTVNYICSHDGFNLMDLVSYNQRHNLANMEDGRDGDAHNYSSNHGEEGATDDKEVNKTRLRVRKNLISMLMLSKGTPMFMAGDEFSNTQDGNNNAYCQDSPISWLSWHWQDEPVSSDGAQMQAFTRKMVHFRRQQALLTDDMNHTVYEFCNAQGEQVDPSFYTEHHKYNIIVKIYSTAENNRDVLLVMMNSGKHTSEVTLPISNPDAVKTLILDTHFDSSFVYEPLHADSYSVRANSLALIQTKR